MESLLESWQSNPEKSSATKINKHTASGYLLFTHCLFDAKKTSMIRGIDCMKNFSRNLKKHAAKIISHEKNK